MILFETKNSPFVDGLLELDHEEAVKFFLKSLKTADSRNEAWELWESVHGDQPLYPYNVIEAIEEVLEVLKQGKSAA